MIEVITMSRSGRFSRRVRATRFMPPVVPEPTKNAVQSSGSARTNLSTMSCTQAYSFVESFAPKCKTLCVFE